MPTVPFFQHCWYTFVIDTWGRNLCMCNLYLWAAKWLNAAKANPWAPGHLKHPSWDSFDRIVIRIVFNRLRTVGSERASIQQGPPEKDIFIDLWYVLVETWTKLGELMLDEETHSSPEMSKDGWKHSTPRLPEVLDFPRCNKADIWLVCEDSSI